jgi:hypothetical protein
MKALTILTAVLAFGSTVQASILTYTGTLSGANEIPPIVTGGTGSAIVTVDTVAQTIEVKVSFSGLTSNAMGAHIHCCVAPGSNIGVATTIPAFAGFPLLVTSGSYDGVLDLTSPATYNPSFVTLEGSLALAEAALLAGLANNQTYLNIHTQNNPNGEIRASLLPTPEPATLLLSGLALAGVAILRRRVSAR